MRSQAPKICKGVPLSLWLNTKVQISVVRFLKAGNRQLHKAWKLYISWISCGAGRHTSFIHSEWVDLAKHTETSLGHLPNVHIRNKAESVLE